jgi:hypothetical protein
MRAVGVFDRVTGRRVQRFADAVVDMILKRFEHAEVVVRHQRVRVNEVLGQLVAVLDYETGRAFD